MRLRHLAILALCGAAPAIAQQSAETPDFASMTDAELNTRVQAIRTEGFANACQTRVPLFAELGRRSPDAQGPKVGHLMSLVYCAADEERHADALRFLKQAEAEYGISGFEPLGLWLAERLEDGPEAMLRLRRMAASGLITRLPVESIYSAMRTIGRHGEKSEFDQFAYELATSAVATRMETESLTALAGPALRHAAASGQVDRVDELLESIRSPVAVIDLLAFREYEPIWPQIERHAGDNLANLSDSYVNWTAIRMADKPEDRERLSDHAHALLFAGRASEAVAAANNWLGDRATTGTLEEGDGWALNVQGYALDALDRHEEADRVFDRLARLSADEHPWVVNFVINRAGRLVELGRWEEALAASELARPIADEYGSDYARMLVAGDRACAFHKLGRLEEGEIELEYVREHVVDAPAAGGEALRCAGRDDEAAELFSTILRDERHRESLLSQLQDPRFELFGTPGSELPGVGQLILARDDLRNEALEYVRVLPERFVPIGYLRRRERRGAPN